MGFICSLDVVKLGLLLAHQWVRITRYENWPRPQHKSCCLKTSPTERDSPQCALVLAKAIFEYAACEVNQVVLLWFEAGHQVHWFWSLFGGAPSRPRSVTACDSSRAIWWELQSDSWLVATPDGPEGVWKRPHCETRLVIISIRPGSSAKSVRHPESCCHLPAIHKSQSLKKPQVVQKLGGAGFWGVISIEAFSGLMQIQV